MKLPGQGAPLEARTGSDDRGYALAVVLVIIAILGVSMTEVLPAWRQQETREKEAELVFRGEQYARAIQAYQRKFGALPPDVDALVSNHVLRHKWKDPINGLDFDLVTGAAPNSGATGATGATGGAAGAPAGRAAGAAPAGGSTAGRTGGGAGAPASSGTSGTPAPGSGGLGFNRVASKDTDASFLIYNGQSQYNLWVFLAPTNNTPPAPGAGGAAGGAGGPGGRGNGTGQGPGGPAGGNGTRGGGARGGGAPGDRGGGPGGRGGPGGPGDPGGANPPGGGRGGGGGAVGGGRGGV